MLGFATLNTREPDLLPNREGRIGSGDPAYNVFVLVECKLARLFTSFIGLFLMSQSYHYIIVYSLFIDYWYS